MMPNPTEQTSSVEWGGGNSINLKGALWDTVVLLTHPGSMTFSKCQ